MNINELRAQADALAQHDVGMDMSQAKKTESFLLPEGSAVARLVEYIEFGSQPQEYQGKAKPAKMEFRLGFALYGDKYVKEDGTPRVISTFDIPLDNASKSKAFLIFSRMNHKKVYKNFAQMLGETFVVSIKHKVDSKGVVRANLDLSAVGPAIDAMTGRPYNVPEAPGDLYKVFLWNSPTQEQWDSLYIEGTRDDGRSKNFLQEKCLRALNYNGSKLQALLEGDVPQDMVASPWADTMPNDDDIPM